MKDIEEEFLISFVYAANTVEERRELWSDIKNHQDLPLFRNKPWLVFGDFNEILDMEEHSGYEGSPTIPPGMRDFQDITRYCSLMDMTYHGPKMTWCNKRDEGVICKKLDRTLMNQGWAASFPQSYCVFEAGGCSDHLRCRIQIQGAAEKPKRPFKFSNAVADHPGFLPLVESHWKETDELYNSTSALFRLAKKLKSLKQGLRNLSRESIGAIAKKTREAFKTLCDLQQQTLLNPSEDAMKEESIAYDRWSLLSTIEEKVISQKAKIHWLRVGDGNNKTFYQVATVRKSRNAIRELQKEDGTVVKTQEEIKEEAVNYFTGFLSHSMENVQSIDTEEMSALLGFECTNEDKEMLVKSVTAEEVRATLFSMANNKSPGPDGYTCEFYKSAWSVVGKDFVVAVQSFFDKGFLPTGINSTILALIPKKDEARHIKDYRPISCCNVIYKVISKLLAGRLKKLLPKFISPNQSAFVKGRLLMENVLLASELVKNYHKENISSRCALKIDISKAFDSVEWSFLLAILSALKIPDKYILWIKRCITMASFSVQVNGELAGYFKSKRGLRQGCSLSPYLFVICMQVLSKMLDKAAVNKEVGYHPSCQALELTHLSFADDLLVFVDGNKKSIDGILNVFKRFANISGLNISIEKSTIYMAGVREVEREGILENFAFDSGELPVRYLGLPLMTKRMTVKDYTPLLEKIRSRISSWTARNLSFAGRLQLIGSVIQSLTNFWISAFRLPKQCINKIDKLCAAFLWSGPELNTKKAKVSWKDVSRPKEEGGLGLKSIMEANNVSCLKLIWRIISEPASLWVRWIKKYLICKGSFWSANINSSLGSWMWKKILKYRPVAANLTKVEIESGSDSSFWFDIWCPLGRIYDIVGDRGTIDLGLKLTATVEMAVLNRRRRRHRTDSLNQVEDELQKLRDRGLTQKEDQRMWKGKGDYRANFSTKETWLITREAQAKTPWHKGIWFTNATPKYSFVTWLAALNRLATGDRIQKWNVHHDPVCIFCNTDTESRNHLFFQCKFSEEVWQGLSHKLFGPRYSTRWSEIVAVLVDTKQNKTKLYLMRYLFQTAVYTLWGHRNSRKHGNNSIAPAGLIPIIDRIIRNRLSALTKMEASKLPQAMQLWFDSQA